MIIRRFRDALRGFLFALSSDHSVQLHVFLGAVALLLGSAVCLSLEGWGILFLAVGSVLAAELFNSALEGLANHLHPDLHPVIGRVKDMSAAGVLVIACAALGVGIILFLPAILSGDFFSCRAFSATV